MKQALDDVYEFHAAAGFDIPSSPTPMPRELSEYRERLLREEFREVMEVLHSGDNERIAGELVDLVYVAVGTALFAGVPIDRVWERVHAANMSKADPATGAMIVDAAGKVRKPEGWAPANISDLCR